MFPNRLLIARDNKISNLRIKFFTYCQFAINFVYLSLNLTNLFFLLYDIQLFQNKFKTF